MRTAALFAVLALFYLPTYAQVCPAALAELVTGTISFSGNVSTSGTLIAPAFFYRFGTDVYTAAITLAGSIVFNTNNPQRKLQ
jgi:hypothetical protein